jgi:hypothetical protein
MVQLKHKESTQECALMQGIRIWKRRLLPPIVGAFCVLSAIYFAAPAVRAASQCLIPPTVDPGIGGLYFCAPEAGERHLITLARRSPSKAGWYEDIWVNFRGVFADRVWINIGLQEHGDAALLAWDALSLLTTWMRAIKAGDTNALEAFLAPLEINPTYKASERHLKRQLLAELTATAFLPSEAPLRIVLYHVHLLPPRKIRQRLRTPLNPWLSIPSKEDLLDTSRLSLLAPGSESKVAVPAGIWTYAWDEAQAAQFVAQHYKGPTETPLTLKFGSLYMHFATTEYRKQGLHDPAALTPERLHHYIETLRPTGVVLQFVFASDWATVQRPRRPK